MTHACSCGEMLPDRRAKFCVTCRGARVKEQESARAPNVKHRVWWLYFATALKVEARFRFMPAHLALRSPADLIAEGARVSLVTVAHAMAERSIGRTDFYTLCKWLKRRPSDFYRDHMATSHKTSTPA